MKYELGDKIRIKKYWQRQDIDKQLKDRGIPNLEAHLISEEMAGDCLYIDKYKKKAIDEVGYVCGIRRFKTSYEVMYSYDEPYVPDGIRQVDYQEEETYLVATRMNTLRRVSFEDIEFIN